MRGSPRFNSAHVIALLALFVAMGSSAYAVKLKLKANSVKTKTIKNRAVTTDKLADGAVTNPKLADGAVTSGKIGGGQVGKAQLAPLTWQSLNGTLTNSWTGSVEVAKDALGFVHMRGAVSGGTSGMTAFTLPPGFQAAAGREFPSVSGGATPYINRISIFADGTVVPTWMTNNTNLSLDQIIFEAEK
jgi:hypothetical protein